MERFFQHHQRYIDLSTAAQRFFLAHGRVIEHAQGAFFMRPDERMPYWCMVLEGLACGYTLGESGERRIHWFAMPMQGFAGVRHLYTPRLSGHYIQFVKASTIFTIPALRMREAKERFGDVSEIIHILKQQYIDRADLLKEVLHQSSTYMRYVTFIQAFPDLAAATGAEEQADFINISRTQLFEARRRWLREGR